MKSEAQKLREKRQREEVKKLLRRFGRHLRQSRRSENLTIRAFAVRARMPYSNVYQMERVRKNPRLSELAQLAQAFKQSLPEFLAPVIRR